MGSETQNLTYHGKTLPIKNEKVKLDLKKVQGFGQSLEFLKKDIRSEGESEENQKQLF